MKNVTVSRTHLQESNRRRPPLRCECISLKLKRWTKMPCRDQRSRTCNLSSRFSRTNSTLRPSEAHDSSTTRRSSRLSSRPRRAISKKSETCARRMCEPSRSSKRKSNSCPARTKAVAHPRSLRSSRRRTRNFARSLTRKKTTAPSSTWRSDESHASLTRSSSTFQRSKVKSNRCEARSGVSERSSLNTKRELLTTMTTLTPS
mmetsp:Transcript_121193/g.170476  ORF Transcript_121193/g.170476 Transcript_121193/m.170476 type:complete len:203 (-) Transcript_121193:15-623(-)